MESRPGHRASKSLHGIRTSVAVLPMAPFSPSRSDLEHSSRTRTARSNWASILNPHKGAAFQSQEPTSPEVSCIGQIKLKQRRVKESIQEKPPKEKKKKHMSKLKKLIFGSQNNNNNHSRAEAEEEDEEKQAVVSHPSLVSYPSMGQIKRYTSGSYDSKFGDMFVQKEVELSSETLPPKSGRKEEGPNIWKRRSFAPPKELEVCRIPVQRFEMRKPFTT